MKKKIINGLLFAVALVAATSSFVSCKDYEGDNYADLNEKYSALQAAYLAQVSAMQDYVLTSRYNSETGYSAAELAAKGTIKARLDELEEYQWELENDSFPKYAKLIHENNIAIAKAQGLAERDSAYLRSLLAGWDKGGSLADMVSEAAGLLTALKSDTAKYNFAYDTLSVYYKQWNEAVKIADSAWNFVNKGQVNVLGKKVESLQDMATLYDGAVNELKEDIEALQNDINDIIKTLRSEITGIEIQATMNPIYGTFSYPYGLESNVLAMYYGEINKSGQDLFFPAAEKDKNWVYTYDDGVAPVLESELKAIKAPGFGGGKALRLKAGEIVMEEQEGNAGVLYLTVNPSNVDFEGKEFTLRTSKNAVSKVQLSKLEECNEELLFGNRRASANGFYKANATISKDVVKDVALNFDFKAVEDEAKYILDNFGNLSARQGAVEVAKLGVAVLTGLQARVPRLGVQAQWKDAVSGEWKNYVSKYSIAAVSAKPLGFNALNVLDNQYGGKIVKIKDAVTAKERAYAKEVEQMIALQFGLPEGTYGDILVDADGKYWLDVNKDRVIDPTVDQDITAIITTIAQPLVKASTDAKNTMESVLNKLISVQNSIFDKAAAIATAPSRYIQPAMLASNDDLGFFYPSRIYLAPTQVKAGKTIKLYPTSLTGEVLAPAFKKYVAILAGPTDGKNYNDNLEGLNTILSGNQYNLFEPIEITLTEKGVYEFIYEAIGYNGIVSGKKYYIEVY